MKRIFIIFLLLMYLPIVFSGAKSTYVRRFCNEGVFEEVFFVELDKSSIQENEVEYNQISDFLDQRLENLVDDINNEYDDSSVSINLIQEYKDKNGKGIVLLFNNYQSYNNFYQKEILLEKKLNYENATKKDYFFYEKIIQTTSLYFEESLVLNFFKEFNNYLEQETTYFENFEQLQLNYVQLVPNSKIRSENQIFSINKTNEHSWDVNFSELEDFEIEVYYYEPARVWFWYIFAISLSIIYMFILFIKNKNGPKEKKQ